MLIKLEYIINISKPCSELAQNFLEVKIAGQYPWKLLQPKFVHFYLVTNIAHHF